MTGADTALTWTGDFDRLVFTTSAEYGRFTFRGTAGTEHLKVDAPTTFDRNIALRGGKDSYESNSLGGKATRIKGDGGRNQLLLELNSHDRVRADLSRSRVTATKAGVEESIRVRGFDDLTVTAKRADVIGTNRANHIIVIACRTTIKGMKGRDGSSVELQVRELWRGLLDHASVLQLQGHDRRRPWQRHHQWEHRRRPPHRRPWQRRHHREVRR